MNEDHLPPADETAPTCGCCGTTEEWDCGMATPTGYGWFCTFCGFNECTTCGDGAGVEFVALEGEL